MLNFDDIIIEDASIRDLPYIVDIYNSTIPGRMVTADTEPVSVESRREWFYAHNPESRPLWVMKYSNEICGWLSFQSFYGRPAYSKTAEVSIYIADKYRGEGLGSLIMNKAIDQCPQLGIKTILGFIFHHNSPSMRLFNKLGFKIWGHFPGIAELDGIERDLVILGKKIGV